MPRFLRPTLEKTRPIRLLTTATTSLKWLRILTATYGTVTTAKSL